MVPCRAFEQWETLPLTPASIVPDRSGQANGIKIHYAIHGHGDSPRSITGAIRFLRSRRATP